MAAMYLGPPSENSLRNRNVVVICFLHKVHLLCPLLIDGPKSASREEFINEITIYEIIRFCLNDSIWVSVSFIKPFPVTDKYDK